MMFPALFLNRGSFMVYQRWMRNKALACWRASLCGRPSPPCFMILAAMSISEFAQHIGGSTA